MTGCKLDSVHGGSKSLMASWHAPVCSHLCKVYFGNATSTPVQSSPGSLGSLSLQGCPLEINNVASILHFRVDDHTSALQYKITCP